MKRSLFAVIACAFFFSMALSGCGGGGGGGSSDDNGSDNNGWKGGTPLGLFTDKVKSCTPYLEGSAASSGTIDLGQWSAWDPKAGGTVLGKLLNPAIGLGECIYSQAKILDDHIGMVNQFSNRWGASGTYTQGDVTAIIDTNVKTVSITYRGLVEFSSEVDRLVTLSVPGQALVIHMAFSQSSGNQTIMEQYTIGGNEAGAYIAKIEGDSIHIWNAGVTSSKVQIMWEGNATDKSFKISECTDASEGNWEVMGGGASTGEMAFMARNKANNDSQDEYYLTISADDLAHGVGQSIINAKTNPPDSTGVLRYITTDSLGFMGDYPDTPDDIAWNQ